MEKIHKIISGMVALGMVVLLLVTLILISSTKNVTSMINKEKEKYEKYVGEKCIIDKDTLTITDYSIFDETFTLSNGQKVHYKLVSNSH